MAPYGTGVISGRISVPTGGWESRMGLTFPAVPVGDTGKRNSGVTDIGVLERAIMIRLKCIAGVSKVRVIDAHGIAVND
jgi:hypothetical protein